MHHPNDPKLPGWSAYLDRLEAQSHHEDGHEADRADTAVAQVQPQVQPQPQPATVRQTDPRWTQPAWIVKITLGSWVYYFLAKLVMYGMELIAFHPLHNLALAAFIMLPAPSVFWRSVKRILTILLALALLYYDSWLPSIARVIAKESSLANFRPSYLLELLTRFVSWQAVLSLFLVWAIYRLLSYWLRAEWLIMLAMLLLFIVQWPPRGEVVSVGPHSAGKTPDMEQVVQGFFDRESQRRVTLPVPDSPPFDVMFIHVCSLSWDDVRAVGLEQHPLWQRFDILLSHFNSAASYSGPAAIHLLRATCGQQSHEKLYQPTASHCYLMDSLQGLGYEPQLALNHNGKFDDFLGQVQTHGRMPMSPLALEGVNIAQYSFYETPVYDDLSVINRWLTVRQKSGSARVALYYDTVSLHDGNYLPGGESLPNTLSSYQARLQRFLDNMEKIMQKLDDSGRRVVVVMVSDHGGAVRGDKRQIPGLREIPTPHIALVPVGIKVVGGGVRRAGATVTVDQPASYLAIAHVLAGMLEKSPFKAGSFVPSAYLVDLPLTPFVAQNENTTVAEYGHRYYLNNAAAGWEDYAEFNASPVQP